jgi:hypothetical protein
VSESAQRIGNAIRVRVDVTAAARRFFRSGWILLAAAERARGGRNTLERGLTAMP